MVSDAMGTCGGGDHHGSATGTAHTCSSGLRWSARRCCFQDLLVACDSRHLNSASPAERRLRRGMEHSETSEDTACWSAEAGHIADCWETSPSVLSTTMPKPDGLRIAGFQTFQRLGHNPHSRLNDFAGGKILIPRASNEGFVESTSCCRAPRRGQ